MDILVVDDTMPEYEGQDLRVGPCRRINVKRACVHGARKGTTTRTSYSLAEQEEKGTNHARLTCGWAKQGRGDVRNGYIHLPKIRRAIEKAFNTSLCSRTDLSVIGVLKKPLALQGICCISDDGEEAEKNQVFAVDNCL